MRECLKAVLHQATIRANCLATEFRHLQDKLREWCCTAMILAACFATTTADDSRESVESFNWLNRCETSSCPNHCEGCYSGQCPLQGISHETLFVQLVTVQAKLRAKLHETLTNITPPFGCSCTRCVF